MSTTASSKGEDDQNVAISSRKDHPLRAHGPAPGQPLPPAVGLRGLSEPRRSDSPHQERPTTCGPPERHGADDDTGALYGAPAGLSVRVRAHDGSPSREARQRRQERVPLGTRDRRDQRLHLARFAAHVRVLANHERRFASISGRTPGPSRPANGDAVRPSLASVPVSGSESVGRASSDIAAGSAGQEKGNVPRRGISGQRKSSNSRRELAPRAGLEPATLRLTAGCSAIELPRNGGVHTCGANRRAT